MGIPRLTLTEQLIRAEVGDVMYSDMKDTVVASYAHRAGVKVKTERWLAIHAPSRAVAEITRITVREKNEHALGKKESTIARAVEETKGCMASRRRKARGG